MELRVCRPDEVPSLLPRALDGEFVLAPVPVDAPASVRKAIVSMLQPAVPVTEPGAAVVLATSGSSGEPKGVVLGRQALRASAQMAQQRLGELTWHCALPLNYVAGLMVLVRAQTAGREPRLVASDLSDLLPTAAGDAISLVPTQLHRALGDERLTSRLREMSVILLGGAPARPALLSAVESAGLRVITTYGMSETCGGCVWDGQPLPGVTVQLSASGRVSLSGLMVFSGYRLRPELTAETLDAQTVHSQDRGRWTADGSLEIVGRVDELVISGGVKVDLAEVQRSTARHTDQPLVVVGVDDEEWGTSVVVLTTDLRDTAWWRAVLAHELPAAALPRHVLHLERLPLTNSGKIDRLQARRIATRELARS